LINKIKVIVFDLGNVLIYFDYNRIKTTLNNIDFELGDRFIKKYYDNYQIHQKFEKWELTNGEFVEIMLDWCENKIDSETFMKIYADLFTENTQITELLPKLKEKYQLVLLSNTNFIHQKYGWEKFEFLKYFNKFILSHEVGAIKPEEKIYKAVENYTNQLSENHLFIDDIKDYVNGAKNLGWNGIQFVSNEKFLLDLKSYNILI